MDIKELKNNIINKNINETFFVWVKNDESSNIIIRQYLNKIVNILNLDGVKYIESIDEIPDNSFVIDSNLYVLITDKWESDYTHNNLIIICNKTNNKSAINIPKLDSWQVVDYAASKVNIGIDNLTNLIKYYNDYQLFLNDIDKLSSFENTNQYTAFTSLLEDGQFNLKSNYTIWDLSTAIIKRDINGLKSILKDIEDIDVEPLGLAKVLYNNFKNILSIQSNSAITPSDLNISDKQFYVIRKFNCGFYSNSKLIDILELLTNVEYLFKYNELPLSSLIDYMIVKILE